MKPIRHLPRLNALTAAIRGSCVAASIIVPGLALAGPTGGNVTAGQIVIAQPDAATTRITQSSASGIIEWSDFSIAQGERVVFDQPSASAAVLNRVTGGAPSEIMGRLQANGRVFLINPQGILFGQSAKVDVGGLVATTMDIADEDFLGGRYLFGGAGPGSVVQQGRISAADGGFVVLGGQKVSNAGLIRARLGDVVLASGSAMTLSMDADGLVGFAVDGAALAADAGVENLGSIVADGGQVALSARTARGLAAATVNHSGRISARSIEEHEGEIVLSAADGSIAIGGVLDASGASGGSIAAQADGDIAFGADAVVTAHGSKVSGGEARFVAAGELDFARGASLDVAGAKRGGVAELSGHGGVLIHGDLEVGHGGRFVLDPGGLVIGNGSSAAGGTCTAGWCEVELEDLLKGGGDVDIIDSTGIVFEDFADGALDGRNNGNGGSLFLGIGAGSSQADFDPDLSSGAISFADASNALLLDGSLTAYAGGNISLGNVSASSVALAANSGAVTTGALAVNNTQGMAELLLDASGKITVNGDIAVTGNAGDLDVAADERVSFAGASLRATSYDEGGIELKGGLTMNGTVGAASLNSQNVAGSSVQLYASNDNVVIRGAVNVQGSVASVTAPLNPLQAWGVQFRATAGFGSVRLLGDTVLQGSIGSISGPELDLAAGVDVDMYSYRAIGIQGLDIDGSIGSVSAASPSAQGAHVNMVAELGNVLLHGPVALTGAVDTANGFDFMTVDGIKMSVISTYGGISLEKGLDADGTVGEISGGIGISASGANIDLSSEQNLVVAGAVDIDGAVGSFTATDDSDVVVSSGAVGAYLSLLTFSGSADIRGRLSVSGHVDGFETAASGFAMGAFVNASSFAAYGSGQSLQFRKGLAIDGQLGRMRSGEFSQMTGAGLYVDAVGADALFPGAIDIDGLIDDARVGYGSDASAAYATVSSFSGAVGASGLIDITGRINRIGGPASLSASGASLSMQGSSAASGRTSLSVRDIHQAGSIGEFSVGDEESSARYDGGVRLDAGGGDIAFRNIDADNIFLYFDYNSTVANSVLTARDYLEIYTDSFGPTLSGASLRIDARNAFLSAYLSYENLTVDADEAITLYLGQLEANNLILRTGGALTLIGGDDPNPSFPAFLSALSLDVRAHAVYGDAGSQIFADGLSMVADDTILLRGGVYVGSQPSVAPGDTGLIGRLQQAAPDLVPVSATPNAYFSADTVALASISITGDHLQMQSNYFFLGAAQFEQAGTLVQLSPLAGLPFFAESVDVEAVGLADVANRVRTDSGRITPNIGRFDDARGSNGPLGERVSLSDAAARGPGELDFSVTTQQPGSFADLILQSGLAGSTIVIGGSDYAGAIQISDALDVDVRPSETNFVFLTRSAILGFDRVLTGGQVVLLEGQLLNNPEDFYKLVAEQFAAYYAALEGPAGESVIAGDDEEKDRDALICD